MGCLAHKVRQGGGNGRLQHSIFYNVSIRATKIRVIDWLSSLRFGHVSIQLVRRVRPSALRRAVGLGLLVLITLGFFVVTPPTSAHAMMADLCPNDPSTPTGIVSLDITSAWLVRNVRHGRAQSELWTAVRNEGTAYACMFAVWASRASNQNTGLFVGFSFGLPAGTEWVTESDPLPGSMVDGPSCLELRVMLMPHPIHTLESGQPRTLCRSSGGDLEWHVSAQPVGKDSDSLRLHVKVRNIGMLGTPPFRLRVTDGPVQGLQYVSIPRLPPKQQHEQEVVVALRGPTSSSDHCLRLEHAEPLSQKEPQAGVEPPREFGELRLNLPVTACTEEPMGGVWNESRERTS